MSPIDDTPPLVLTNGNTLRPKVINPVAYNDFDPSPAAVEKFLDTDTNYRAATFIETYTGRAFWPLRPTKEALSIIDIAHALANQCRYSGHVRHFYSVAQHCCLLAHWMSEHGGSAMDCLQILMHDAPEAYLVDIPRPVKQYMPQYRVWDHAINDVVRDWMGWKDLPILPIQDELDSRVIVDERAQLMDRARTNDWGHKMEPLGINILPWTPEQAEKIFLRLYAAYSLEAYGAHQYINFEWGKLTDRAVVSDSKTVLDLLEVDMRGRVGRVKLRGDDGILARDASAGAYPRPDWKWVHGDFTLTKT
jgi:uncharacterized protein